MFLEEKETKNILKLVSTDKEKINIVRGRKEPCNLQNVLNEIDIHFLV